MNMETLDELIKDILLDLGNAGLRLILADAIEEMEEQLASGLYADDICYKGYLGGAAARRTSVKALRSDRGRWLRRRSTDRLNREECGSVFVHWVPYKFVWPRVVGMTSSQRRRQRILGCSLAVDTRRLGCFICKEGGVDLYAMEKTSWRWTCKSCASVPLLGGAIEILPGRP